MGGQMHETSTDKQKVYSCDSHYGNSFHITESLAYIMSQI